MSRFAPQHRQHDYQIRLEWGQAGAAAVGPVDIAVVVDVLSFTTTLTVAVERGIEVFPLPWRDERAEAYAAERDAVLAVARLEGGPGAGGVTLSPAAMGSVRGVGRIVLPSPNGSTIAFGLAESGAQVVGGCLRNRLAVAGWLAPLVAEGTSLAVIPAGERWPDGSLRPALEDLWGAGAILAALSRELRLLGAREAASPEARYAARAFPTTAPGDLTAGLLGCASGRELVERGYRVDVELAGELDASIAIPLLRDGVFASA